MAPACAPAVARLWRLSRTMKTEDPIRRTLLIPFATCLAAAALMGAAGGAARANELLASGEASGLVIHDADETLHRYCTWDAQGRLWLGLPGGARYELVTSTADPAIANQGDGAFHTFDGAEVRAALADVSYPLDRIRADVFILPFPRRHGLESAAGPQMILLAPGVRPLSRAQQHAELAHELGHVVQYALMPDPDGAAWVGYRRLRGIENAAAYSAASPHADRPHEIFAEDFRVLFGGPLASPSGSIENSTIRPPAEVAGLTAFMLELSGAPRPAVRSMSFTNPARGRMTLSLTGGRPKTLDLFDVAGRRLISLAPLARPDRVEWTWDGHDANGRPVARGMLLARVRGAGKSVRISWLP